MATAEKTSTTRKPASGFKPTLVHAYRRQPHYGSDGKELDVEVVFQGEKIKLRSNEHGHIVGEVKTEAAFNRLTKEIPEAYIVYQGGENVPEPVKPGEPEPPKGDFVLSNGEETVVLDDMGDEELRAFAAQAGIEAAALPDVLTGETLVRAIYNTLQTG